MTTHPVQFNVERAGAEMARIHVLIRLALLLAVGAIGCSSLYWILYLAAPAVIALLIANGRSFADQVPRLVRGLRWLAAAYAYLWMLTDAFPANGAPSPVTLTIEPSGQPSVRSAVLRVVYSFPALLLLAILSFAAWLMWLVAALCVLTWREVPLPLADFLELVLRYQFRLVAYHLSLVDEYPALGMHPGVPARPAT